MPSSSVHRGAQTHSHRRTETGLPGKEINALKCPREAEAALWTPQTLKERGQTEQWHPRRGSRCSELRPAASPSLSPSWISRDNELNTIFDSLRSSACCERPGIPCLHRDNYLSSQKSLWTQPQKANEDENGLHGSEKVIHSPIPNRSVTS